MWNRTRTVYLIDLISTLGVRYTHKLKLCYPRPFPKPTGSYLKSQFSEIYQIGESEFWVISLWVLQFQKFQLWLAKLDLLHLPEPNGSSQVYRGYPGTDVQGPSGPCNRIKTPKNYNKVLCISILYYFLREIQKSMFPNQKTDVQGGIGGTQGRRRASQGP